MNSRVLLLWMCVKNEPRRPPWAHAAASPHHQHIRCPPRPQMKEESAGVVNARRAVISNKRRIARLKATGPSFCTESSGQRRAQSLSRLVIRLPNTHDSVALRCLHRHLEQSRTGC